VDAVSEHCSSGCKTKDHASYGECLRSNTPTTRNSTQSVSGLYQREYINALEISEYKAARAQGIQPRGSKLGQIRYAVEASKRADAALTIT
jgi:hypothetical protein